MHEILITDCQVNPDELAYRQWSYNHKDIYHVLDEFFNRLTITPQSHPHVADLAAGDGSVAYYFATNGWKPHDITCIDKYFSPTPLVTGVIWKFMNLHRLYQALKIHEALPVTIEKLRGTYDIVIEQASTLSPDETPTIAKFFTRPGGFTYITYHNYISK